MSILRVQVRCPFCGRLYRLRLDPEKLEQRGSAKALCGRCGQRFTLTPRMLQSRQNEQEEEQEQDLPAVPPSGMYDDFPLDRKQTVPLPRRARSAPLGRRRTAQSPGSQREPPPQGQETPPSSTPSLVAGDWSGPRPSAPPDLSTPAPPHSGPAADGRAVRSRAADGAGFGVADTPLPPASAGVESDKAAVTPPLGRRAVAQDRVPSTPPSSESPAPESPAPESPSSESPAPESPAPESPAPKSPLRSTRPDRPALLAAELDGAGGAEAADSDPGDSGDDPSTLIRGSGMAFERHEVPERYPSGPPSGEDIADALAGILGSDSLPPAVPSAGEAAASVASSPPPRTSSGPAASSAPPERSSWPVGSSPPVSSRPPRSSTPPLPRSERPTPPSRPPIPSPPPGLKTRESEAPLPPPSEPPSPSEPGDRGKVARSGEARASDGPPASYRPAASDRPPASRTSRGRARSGRPLAPSVRPPPRELPHVVTPEQWIAMADPGLDELCTGLSDGADALWELLDSP